MPRAHSYTPAQLEQAIAAVNDGSSLRKSAKDHGVPRSTIVDRLKGRQTATEAAEWRQKLDPHQERKVVNWALMQSALGVTPSHRDLREFAQKVLTSSGSAEIIGAFWVPRLLARNPELRMTQRGGDGGTRELEDGIDVDSDPDRDIDVDVEATRAASEEMEDTDEEDDTLLSEDDQASSPAGTTRVPTPEVGEDESPITTAGGSNNTIRTPRKVSITSSATALRRSMIATFGAAASDNPASRAFVQIVMEEVGRMRSRIASQARLLDNIMRIQLSDGDPEFIRSNKRRKLILRTEEGSQVTAVAPPDPSSDGA